MEKLKRDEEDRKIEVRLEKERQESLIAFEKEQQDKKVWY
jgi:hypothetical protein